MNTVLKVVTHNELLYVQTVKMSPTSLSIAIWTKIRVLQNNVVRLMNTRVYLGMIKFPFNSWIRQDCMMKIVPKVWDIFLLRPLPVVGLFILFDVSVGPGILQR